MSFLFQLILFFVTVYVFVALIAVIFEDEVRAAQDRDPAAKGKLQVVLLYAGFHAIVLYRLANALRRMEVPFFPRAISQLGRFLTGIEIHPGATIGRGLFIDHGTGVVIGETTIIGDNVTLFQGVTLGGTGKESGKRHPTIGNNVVVGAGAKVLGNIKIGENSYIGANAVVIKEVPPNSTVVGVPGRVTRQDGKKLDVSMDHIHILDPMMQQIEELNKKIQDLEHKLREKNKA